MVFMSVFFLFYMSVIGGNKISKEVRAFLAKPEYTTTNGKNVLTAIYVLARVRKTRVLGKT